MSIVNTPEAKSSLIQLKDAHKFGEDFASLYLGAPNEEIRATADEILNIAISRLVELPETGFKQDQLWIILEDAAMEYAKMDSEELEQAMVYFEQIMDIYGIESSGGRLKDWRYGIQP